MPGPVKTVTLQLAAITAEANRDILKTGAYYDALRKKNPVELGVRFDRLQALAQAKILSRELSGVVSGKISLDAGQGGIAGLLAKLTGGGQAAGGGLASLLGTGGTAGAGAAGIGGIGAAGIGAGALAAITALESGIGGIVPALAAAGAGVASFGALAMPTFTTVTGAVTQIAKDTATYQAATTAAAKSTALKSIRADWAALSPAQKTAVKGIQGLQAAFAAMAAKFAPVVLPLISQAVKIAGKLLPQLLPFAKAAAGAFGTLLTGFSKFASSPGFKTFLAQLAKLTGPAIVTIGEGIGKIAIAAGKLLAAMINPNGIKALRLILAAIAGVITGIAWAFARATPLIIRHMAETASAFRHVREFAADAWKWISDHWPLLQAILEGPILGLTGFVARNFDAIRTTIGSVVRSIEDFFLGMIINMLRGVKGFADFMGTLPGPLGAPFRAAAKAVQGVIDHVQALKRSIDGLHGKNVTIGVLGTGHWTVTGSGPVTGRSPGGVHLTAAGMRIPGYGGGDRWPLLAESGETVVSKEHSRMLAPVFRAAGVPGYAGGGVIGRYAGSVQGTGPWAAGNVAATTVQLENAVAMGALRALRAAQAATGPLGAAPPTSGTAVRWLLAAMAATGSPASWLPGEITIMMHESGGNPLAYNPTGDASGHAEGLMQMKPGTYAAFATLAGGIWNPVSNAAASMRYQASQYGSPYNIPGVGNGAPYVGYGKGGPIPEAIWGIGKSGQRYGFHAGETVIPARGGQKIVLEIRAGHGEVEQLLVKLMQRHVRVAGGGDVQIAFGG